MNTNIAGMKTLRPLSAGKQQQLAQTWDERNEDPLAFVPHEERLKGLSAEMALEVNRRFGTRFAAKYLKELLLSCDFNSLYRRKSSLLAKPKIVAVGFGRGYDSNWLREAWDVGLETWWFDVSPLTCWIAAGKLASQVEATRRTIPDFHAHPESKYSEIQSLLAKPLNVQLDLDTVKIWYLCRLLNCLSTSSAKVVLQAIGHATLGSASNSEKKNSVVIINALRDDNPDLKGTTSIVRSKNMILYNMRIGADRPIEAVRIKRYRYFSQIYTAMTIVAK